MTRNGGEPIFDPLKSVPSNGIDAAYTRFQFREIVLQ